jgi:parvulin-like peptidyl-prolyl isomerase
VNMLFEPEIIIEFLKREVQLKEICQKVLCRQVIDRAAQERGIIVTAEEIQIEADRQRHQKRLESAAATFAWLQDQLITPDDWEAGIRNNLISQKLADVLFTPEVGKYFAEHRLDFEQILLYKLVVPYEQLAQEIFYQVEESEISFYEAAHLYDIDERRRLQCGYEGKLYRWSLKPEIAAIIFSARAREIMSPLQTEQGYELLMVEEFISAELTPEISQKIINRLFEEWLESELNYVIHQDELPADSGLL